MFRMRPATGADERAITRLIRDRAAWMRDNELAGWEGWHERAEVLAGQASDPNLPVWSMIDTHTDTVVGVTSVFDQTASRLLWPDDLTTPALFLATTATDPAYRTHRPGCLIAWWALDHAARTGYQSVRRGTGPYPGLIAYYQNVQGWTLTRTVEHQGLTAYGLERRAELQPQLPSLGMRLI